MPSLIVGDLVRCLTGKLQAAESPGRRHRTFEVFQSDGTLVARTRVSHGWRGGEQLGDDMVSVIRRQLNLSTGQQLTDLVSCVMSRDDYLQAQP
jgi:hypothetical protein